MKVIVIGSNHAGTAATNTILGNYPDAEVVVYDKNSNISFLGCGMALWIGKQIEGSDGLFYSSADKLTEAGATVHMEAEVTDVDPQAKTIRVRMKDGQEITDNYDKLIVATGSQPIIPRIPGIDLENVQRVKLFQDAQAVIDKINSQPFERVAVVGAGYIGVELAEAFRRLDKEVDLIDLAPTALSTYYDEPFSDEMVKNLEDNGIHCHFGEKVEEILGENGKVTGIRTDKGEYPTDMAVMCIGFVPNASLLKDKVETFKNGAYVVDLHQQTSDPNIFAIGDCATLWFNAIDEKAYIALATNAVRSGIVAAHNACGTALESIGVQGSNGICIFDLKMVSTGLSLQRAKEMGIDAEVTDFEDTQKPAFIETENPAVKLRIVYRKDNRQVIGAQMSSTWDMSMGIHFFSLAIQEKVTIDRLALTDIFFLPHFNQPYNYITMAAITAK